MSLFEQLQTEAQFQAAITSLATLNGWDWFHIQPGLTERGRYRSPVSGSLGVGWPDLVMVKGDRLLFVEVKSQKGQVTSLQRDVLGLLAQIPAAEVFIWRPSDWPLVCEVLAGEQGFTREQIRPVQSRPRFRTKVRGKGAQAPTG